MTVVPAIFTPLISLLAVERPISLTVTAAPSISKSVVAAVSSPWIFTSIRSPVPELIVTLVTPFVTSISPVWKVISLDVVLIVVLAVISISLPVASA